MEKSYYVYSTVKGTRKKRQGEGTKEEVRILNLVGQTFLSDK